MRVAVIYHIFPHYRLGVIKELDRSPINLYTFIGSSVVFDGIDPINKTEFRRFIEAPFRIFFNRLIWQPAAISAAISNDYDVIIYLANPNFLSTWFSAFLAKLFGKRVIFWTHGWIKSNEPLIKRSIRRLFYCLADKLFVYGERAKGIGVNLGVPQDKISVIYNSLDFSARNLFLSEIKAGVWDGNRPQSLFSNPDCPLIICTARLTSLCRFDLLFDAVEFLKQEKYFINILLIGDGPERGRLELAAKELGIDVVFRGACYDEKEIGPYLYFSDVCVSPGKIGLTAMHSLMYGTPAITHSNFDKQMPEFEAITSCVTGDFFNEGDSRDLAFVLKKWLKCNQNRDVIRAACIKSVEEKWNPLVQASIIEGVINDF